MKKIIFILSILAQTSFALDIDQANKSDIYSKLGFDTYISARRTVRVAILDNGFDGASKSLRLKSFVDNGGKLVNNLAKYPEYANSPTDHGLSEAHILLNLTGANLDSHLELYFFNTQGILNFRAALKDLIPIQPDVVIYAQNWSFFGDFQGKGSVDDLINDFLNSSPRTLFITSVGNSKDRVIHLPINRLPPFHSQEFLIENLVDQNTVTIDMTWSDPSWKMISDELSLSKNDDDVYQSLNNLSNKGIYATSDLDLVLLDDHNNILEASAQYQGAPAQTPQGLNYQILAREKLFFPDSSKQNDAFMEGMPKGKYKLRVMNNSPEKFSNNDLLHIVIVGTDIKVTSLNVRTTSSDKLMPADLNRLLSIGDCDIKESALGGDFYLPSQVIFTNKQVVSGSSSATAIAAAKIVQGLVGGANIFDKGSALQFLNYRTSPFLCR